MKGTLLTILAVLAVSGCTAQGPVYSWYHPLGGEYLFAYDHGECVSEMQEMGLSLGNNTDGPFFKCMENRGYSLIGDDVNVPDYEQLGILDLGN